MIGDPFIQHELNSFLLNPLNSRAPKTYQNFAQFILNTKFYMC